MSATNVGNVVLEKRNRHMWKRMDGWRRIGVAGVVGAAALVALGDRGQTQVAPQGQDPLEILNLQVARERDHRPGQLGLDGRGAGRPIRACHSVRRRPLLEAVRGRSRCFPASSRPTRTR